MKKILTLLSTLLIAIAGLAAPSATSVLQRSAAKIKGAESLHVSYTATADGSTTAGSLVLQGDMFTISSPGMMSWYDGKSQWTYSTQIGEVNIITPTPEEVSQINPFAIVKSFSTDYTPSLLKSVSGSTTVRLVAKNKKSDISQAEITIDDRTSYPTRVILTMANRQKVTINIKDVKAGKKLPVANFRYTPGQFPGVNVVDLR